LSLLLVRHANRTFLFSFVRIHANRTAVGRCTAPRAPTASRSCGTSSSAARRTRSLATRCACLLAPGCMWFVSGLWRPVCRAPCWSMFDFRVTVSGSRCIPLGDVVTHCPCVLFSVPAVYSLASQNNLTCLHLCARTDNVEMARYLINEAKLNPAHTARVGRPLRLLMRLFWRYCSLRRRLIMRLFWRYCSLILMRIWFSFNVRLMLLQLLEVPLHCKHTWATQLGAVVCRSTCPPCSCRVL